MTFQGFGPRIVLKMGEVCEPVFDACERRQLRMSDFRKEEDNEEYFPEGTVHEDEFEEMLKDVLCSCKR